MLSRLARSPLCRRMARPLAASTLAATIVVAASPVEVLARKLDEPNSASLVGSYLAGRFARGQHDTSQAADFYRSALARDPTNEVLLEQAFQMEASEGNWDNALRYAEQLVARQATHRMARVFLALGAFKKGDLKKADEHLIAASNGPIGELTSALARAWVKLADGAPEMGMALLDVPKQAEWAQYYLRYHRALVADIAGRKADARAAYERVFKQDSRTLRTALAYARHAAHSGDYKHARQVLKDHLDRSQGEGHALARDLRDRVNATTPVDLLVQTPIEGMAEVFYGLGEALTGEGGVSIGVLYLQMALYLVPDHAFALAALANAHETTKRYQEAIETYERIPKGTALQPGIEIRKAFNLNSLDRVEEARELLEKLAKADQSDLKALDALGNIMRARKRYAEAAEYYSRAIAQLPGKLEKRHWSYFYARGTSYERLKKWPLAEADLQKAMQLYPDQPLVLNYLGYSWVDQGRNLKQGMSLIEKAVSLKPDDGYIVDSLGWAHYKQGNFKEAVRYLERAVELKPEDPVLNDHLGDALWRVGREREARYQWEQSLTLSPEPEDAEKIKKKLMKGLAPQAQAKTVVPRKTREASQQVRKRAAERIERPDVSPATPVLE